MTNVHLSLIQVGGAWNSFDILQQCDIMHLLKWKYAVIAVHIYACQKGLLMHRIFAYKYCPLCYHQFLCPFLFSYTSIFVLVALLFHFPFLFTVPCASASWGQRSSLADLNPGGASQAASPISLQRGRLCSLPSLRTLQAHDTDVRHALRSAAP